MFHYMAVDDAVLCRGYGKEIQLTLDPSHDCLCMKAIVVEYVGLTFLGRLSLTLSRHCSDSFADARFIRLRGRTPGVKRPINRFLPASMTRRLVAFMLSPDKTSSAMRTPVFNAPLPNATAPLLMSGMALRSKPPNKLSSP